VCCKIIFPVLQVLPDFEDLSSLQALFLKRTFLSTILSKCLVAFFQLFSSTLCRMSVSCKFSEVALVSSVLAAQVGAFFNYLELG